MISSNKDSSVLTWYGSTYNNLELGDQLVLYTTFSNTRSFWELSTTTFKESSSSKVFVVTLLAYIHWTLVVMFAVVLLAEAGVALSHFKTIHSTRMGLMKERDRD